MLVAEIKNQHVLDFKPPRAFFFWITNIVIFMNMDGHIPIADLDSERNLPTGPAYCVNPLDNIVQPGNADSSAVAKTRP